ncbi:MAG: winged helix-turn-helix domain-containing protein, partial [Chitinophagaceae bacterium]
MFTQPTISTQVTNIYQILRIDSYATTPKYQQLVNAIVQGIEEGIITKNDVLPSINDLSYELDISRDTGVRAYKELKNMGLLASVAGKGYYIASTEIEKGLKVCLLFNKLSTHKKIIYDSFCKSLGVGAAVDFYIYNNDFAVFKKLLKSKEKQYDYYVIIPHFVDGGEQAGQLIDSIPKDRLIMMDKLLPGQEATCGAVFEDFERDIYKALESAAAPLQKYQQIK